MSTIAPEITKTSTLWTFDPAHSQVNFSVKHMMVTNVRGQFTSVNGKAFGEVHDPIGTEIDVEIDAASITTHNEQRDNHLRSADFLDAENFPTITFKSTRIEPKGADRFDIYGDLTLRGTTREVRLETELNGQGTTPYGTEVVGVSAKGEFNRKDFGLTYNMALEAGGFLVGDTVKIDIEVEAVKQPAQS